jgi:hypothetical protein
MNEVVQVVAGKPLPPKFAFIESDSADLFEWIVGAAFSRDFHIISNRNAVPPQAGTQDGALKPPLAG